jgi:hypothetical protein
MRSWIITAAVGLVALGLTTLSPSKASAQQVIITPPPVVVAPSYYPAPVVVAPSYYPPPVVVAPSYYPPVVVAPPVYVAPRFRPFYYARPRGFVRVW